MFIIDILFAAVIGLLLTLLFGFGLGRKGPWSSALIFFLIVFMASWAVGNMAEGLGPEIGGFYYVPYLIGAIIIALLLAAATPFRLYHHRESIIEKEERKLAEGQERSPFDAAYDKFFWAFLVALLILIILGYTSYFYGR